MVNIIVTVKDITLYQICYSPEQVQNCPDGTTPWDNTLNAKPDLREFPVFEMEYVRRALARPDNSYWGFISPKFQSKAGISPKQFIDWVNANPGVDVYFINPCPIQEVLWPNVIEQGEYWHPGLKEMIYKGLNKAHVFSSDLIDDIPLRMGQYTFAFCNYFIGNMKFWDSYISFVQKFIRACENDPQLNHMLYVGNANYNRDRSLPYYPFVVERLFSTFLTIYNHITTLNYRYTYEDLKHKMTQVQFAEMTEISKVKLAAVSSNFSLWSSWEFFRYQFNLRNPELFHKE